MRRAGLGLVLVLLSWGCERRGEPRQQVAAQPLGGATIYVATSWVSGPWEVRPNGVQHVLRARAYCEPYDVLMTGGCELPVDGLDWSLVGTAGDPTWPITGDAANGRSSWTCTVVAPVTGPPGEFVGVHAQCSSAN